ncbi:MAG: mucoidy inhibitor MuiA family protein [Candidatus Omnitrophota bacterium]
MRRISIFSFIAVFLALSFTYSFAEVITSGSKITQVTVYPGSARITRQAQVNLSAGEHTIVFDHIIPAIDQNSLSIAGQGQAKVKLYGASFKSQQLPAVADERVRKLEEQIEALNDQANIQNAKSAALNQQKEFILSVKAAANQQIPKDIMTKMPTAQDLGGISDFIGKGLQGLSDQEEVIRLEVRRIAKERDVVQRELNQLRGGGSEKAKRSIEVELACEKPGSFTLEASYMVFGPQWRPVYDARTEFSPAQVEMISYAMVKQNTGEDWSNVELTLSTVQPLLGGSMPYVNPWIVKPIEPMVTGGGRSKRMLLAKSAVQYEAYSNDMARMEDVSMTPAEPQALAEVSYANVVQKGISVTFKIARPVVLTSDGTERKFPITVQLLKADYEYATFPKAAALAYLGSRVMNREDLNLLAGEVNLFVEGDYIGKSSIDNIGPGETFDLYLGADENVKVKREMIKKEIDKTLFANISSPNNKITYTYKLIVENYKTRDIKVKLFEAMPTAQDDRIKIKIFDVSVEPLEKNWKDRLGVWLWEFSLKPKEKKEIRYSFTIDYPKNLPIPEMD